MRPQDLDAECRRLENQIKIIKKSFRDTPEEIISLSCQAVCVAICGSLEQNLKRIFVEYARQRSGGQIHRPIERLCDNYQNPKSSKVLELVKLFDRDFGKELGHLWDGEKEVEKSRLDNLVGDRIAIAHSRQRHVNVSVGKLENYHQAHSALVNRIYDHFLGS
ncbi:MAG: hypothetical protein OXC91_10580 [Rhodobacteraceae bacterium]|nr:hypothetical protein [Paracoccaceae bacterium]